MSQTVSNLSERLARLEEEISLIRKELIALHSQAGAMAPAQSNISVRLWADKASQQQKMNDLFAALKIKAQPVGISVLQSEMERAGLDRNELSADIIAAREE